MNLKRLVKDLIDTGLTQGQIGKAIGRSQPVISAIARKNPKRPLYETAEALKKFHAQRMRELERS